MTEWLLQFDRKIGLQKRKILLFMDNAGSHPRDLKLTNIKIIFLPPNTTSFCQPLDQGIIQNFKTYYRTLILKHILSKVDSINSASELSKSIDLLEAIYFVKKAWQQVSSTTIMNCFPKSGSRHNDVHEVNDEFDTEDDLPLSVIAELCKCIQDSRLSHHDTNNLDNFINIDEALTTEDNNVDVSGTDLVRQDDGTLVEVESDDEDTEELEDMDETDDGINAYQEAFKTIKNLKIFAKKKDDFIAFDLIKNVEMHFETAYYNNVSSRQTSLRDYFTVKN
jgi:hypothetical protein